MARPDIAAIKERAAKATEGPWDASLLYDVTDETFVEGPQFGFRGDIDDPYSAIDSDWQRQIWADAAFIAHAREDIPALLAWVRILEDRLRAVAAAYPAFASVAVGLEQPARPESEQS